MPGFPNFADFGRNTCTPSLTILPGGRRSVVTIGLDNLLTTLLLRGVLAHLLAPRLFACGLLGRISLRGEV